MHILSSIDIYWTRKAFSSSLEPLLKPRSYMNLNQSFALSLQLHSGMYSW